MREELAACVAMCVPEGRCGRSGGGPQLAAHTAEALASLGVNYILVSIGQQL